MTEPLRILLVEDSPADAALETREIMRAHPDAQCVVTDSLVELERLLTEGEFDLVLSDYELQGFNALDNLEKARSIRPDIPFVVMSGNIGEERAVQLMRAGVTDFLMKDSISRLVSVVDRAVREARDRGNLLAAEDRLIDAGREWQRTFDSISDAILSLDKDGGIRRVNAAAPDLLGLDPSVVVGEHAREILLRLKPGSRLEDCAHLLNTLHVQFEWGPCGLDGRWFNVTCDAVMNGDGNPTGHVMVISDITQRKRAEQEQAALYRRLQRTMEGTVAIAINMVERRDPYTAGHQEGVATESVEIAKRLGLASSDVEAIRTAALLHDIGKISVPSEILVRTGPLGEIEWVMIRQHPEVGATILEEAAFDADICEIVLQHHERMDGSGYPQKLQGEAIRLEARIIAVADVVESMLSHRPYRAALTYEDTVEELRSGRGTRYDERVVDACLAMLEERHTVPS